jgi:thioredoxin 1
LSRVVELDSSNFDRMIRTTKKKVFVDFWAPWCKPCLRMDNVIERVADRHEAILFAKVNVDRDGAIAQRYHVSSIPTYLIFDGANPAESRVGALSEADLERLVSSYSRR